MSEIAFENRLICYTTGKASCSNSSRSLRISDRIVKALVAWSDERNPMNTKNTKLTKSTKKNDRISGFAFHSAYPAYLC